MKVVWEGVAVLCKSEDGRSLLMVLQGRADETPTWAVPGGSIQTDESPAEAAVRETMEETGLDVRILRRYTTAEGVTAYGPYRVHYFEAEVIGGRLRACDPDGLIHQVTWVRASALPNLRLTHEDQRQVLTSYLSSSGPLSTRVTHQSELSNMTRQTVDLLAIEMDEAWQTLCHWLDGLTEEEFFWKPIPDCWTAHPDETGRWVLDYAVPDPDPAPFTTIAWRLIHIATCKVMYHEYAFGPGELTWETLEIPHTLADTIALLEDGHDRLRRALDDLADADLEEQRLTNWGELWPTWRIFWTMVSHDLHHGAEIGCLRDLYRALPAKTQAR